MTKQTSSSVSQFKAKALRLSAQLDKCTGTVSGATALEDGESFDAALGRMQAEGIAEADPSLDVDGWDAAAKTSALANVPSSASVSTIPRSR